MKKKRTKRVSVDLFPEYSVFDFSKDPINKFRSKQNRPNNIKSWSNKDFLSYVREKIGKSLVQVGYYDIQMIINLQDRITSNLKVVSSKKNVNCDNLLLKQFLDWWLNSYKSSYLNKNILIGTELFCKERFVREFFQHAYSEGTGAAQSIAVAIKKSIPPRKLYKDLYDAGGLKKLIYDAGIVDSYNYLVQEEKKPSSVVVKEVRKTLLTLHEAVFDYVVEKTVRSAPYDSSKYFDVAKVLKPVLVKRNSSNFQHLRLDCLFYKENS